jgi:MtrB/PioB family decaheme-associated outer membrane protein
MVTGNQHRILALAVAMPGFFFVAANDAQAVDTPTAAEIKAISENWVCKWCPYPEQAQSAAEITAGAGYVSNDSYKHGDYTGLDEKGVYFIGDAEYSYQSPQHTYIDVTGSELGTDARDVSVKGRSQGELSGGFGYSELPKLNLDTARTPYTGEARQQLPAGWTDGGTTQAMPQLAGALHAVDIYSHRKTFTLGATYQQNSVLSYTFNFQRDTKEGARTAGLALGNVFASARSSILAIPVDHVTDQGEIKVNYVKRNWQAAVAYQFSRFDNGEKSVSWENAFSAPAGVNDGQAALEPDNSMHKIAVSGSYRISSGTSTNGLIAFGQMKQNDSYLPYTINGSLSPFALPVTSLDAKINTFDAVLNFNTRLSEQFKLEARYYHNEQDNQTSRNSYDYIVADTAASGTSRANFPYSFRKVQYRVAGKYQLKKHEMSVGALREVYDRTYQEVETTVENTLQATYRTNILSYIDLQIRGARSERDGDNYVPVTEIIPSENPLLRKYNLADRDRDQLGVTVNYDSMSNWQLSFYLDAYKDLYSKSDIGLLESIQEDYGVSWQYAINQELYLNVDYSMTTIESTQAGSQSFSVATWHAVNDDRIDAIHLGVDYDVIPKKLKLGFEYSYAESEGAIKVSTDVPLPVLISTRHTFMVRGDYRLSKQSTIVAFYRYEDYDESDWAVDNVNPDTIANVLSLGEVSPSYQVGTLGVSLRHVF